MNQQSRSTLRGTNPSTKSETLDDFAFEEWFASLNEEPLVPQHQPSNACESMVWMVWVWQRFGGCVHSTRLQMFATFRFIVNQYDKV